MSSPITVNIISAQSTTTDDDTKEEQPVHLLKFRYDNQQFEYKLAKGFDPDDDDLFENIVTSIQNRFKLNGDIKILDLENYNVVDMDDIEDHLDDDETLGFTVQHVPKENDDIKSNDNGTLCVVKRTSACTSDTPIDPHRMLNEVDLNNATLQSIQNDIPQKNDDLYRIYFYLNQDHVTKVFVCFAFISQDKINFLHPMKRVDEKLYYTEVNIPWAQHQTATKVKFRYKYRIYRGGITIDSKDTWSECDGEREIYKGSLGYYSTYTTVSWYYTDMQRNAGNEIIDHIIKQNSHTYESYQISSQLMTTFSASLKDSAPHALVLFKQVVSDTHKNHQMSNVFKLQLLQTYINLTKDRFYVMKTETVYRIIETYFKDRKYRRQQIQIGQEIYNSFIQTVRDLLRNRRDKRDDEKLSSKEYVLLHPIYNFFHYFENRTKRKPLIFDKKGYIGLCESDRSWNKLPSISNILGMDLNIADLPHCQRRYPLEYLVIKLCHIKKANGARLFKQCLETISLKQETPTIYDAMFENDVCRIHMFSVLRADFGLWQELIVCIGVDVIVMNQKILKDFRRNLQRQIDMMSSKSAAKLTDLTNLTINYPQLFDTPEILCTLLRNFKLIQREKQLANNTVMRITEMISRDNSKITSLQQENAKLKEANSIMTAKLKDIAVHPIKTFDLQDIAMKEDTIEKQKEFDVQLQMDENRLNEWNLNSIKIENELKENMTQNTKDLLDRYMECKRLCDTQQSRMEHVVTYCTKLNKMKRTLNNENTQDRCNELK
eukprot:852784_1